MSDQSGIQVAVIADGSSSSVRKSSGNRLTAPPTAPTACVAYITPRNSQGVADVIDRALTGSRGAMSLRMAVPLTVGALIEAVSPGWASSLGLLPAHSRFKRLRQVLSDNEVRILHLHLTERDKRPGEFEVALSGAIFHELAFGLGLDVLVLSGREEALAACLDDPQIRRRLRASRVGAGPSWEDDVSRQVRELGS